MVELLNPSGIVGLAIPAAFILLYLIQPRVIEQTIPSLLFMIEEDAKNKRRSFFRKLLTNALFWIQLLIFLLIALAVLEPLDITEDSAYVDNIIFVIDASASMQTKAENGQSRFQQAKAFVRENAKSANTLIVAGRKPTIISKKEPKVSVLAKLAAMQPEATSTNLESAINLADKISEGERATIYVLSDFRSVYESDNPLKAKKLLVTNEKNPVYIDLSSEVSNVGIVNARLDRQDTRMFIKNYDTVARDVLVTIHKEGTQLGSQQLNIDKKTIQEFTLKTPQGQSEVRLNLNDGFSLDNTLYITNPEFEPVKVVVITSDPDALLIKALQANPDVQVEVKVPPFTIASIKESAPEIIIVHDINKEEILINDFNEIKKLLGPNRHLIISAQKDLAQIDFYGLLPITNIAAGEQTQMNLLIENSFTRDIVWPTLNEHLTGDVINNQTLVLAESEDQSPLLALHTVAGANVIYYGIIDDKSDFKNTLHYPLFWHKLIKFLVKREDIDDFNFQTNSAAVNPKVGFQKQGSKQVAVNLLNEQESDVGAKNKEFKKENAAIELQKSDIKKEIFWDYYLALAILALLLIELAVQKYRGDL